MSATKTPMDDAHIEWVCDFCKDRVAKCHGQGDFSCDVCCNHAARKGTEEECHPLGASCKVGVQRRVIAVKVES